MNMPQKTHAGHAIHPLRSQALTRCLPIAGAICLMFWLSGGIYPRTWQFFFQACAQFSQLWAEWRGQFLLSFVVLTIQALLLAVGWWLLLQLAIREGSALFAAWRAENTPVPVAPFPAPAAGASASRPPVAQVHASPRSRPAVPPAVPPVQMPGVAAPPRNMQVQAQQAAPPASPFVNPVLENPFEEPGPAGKNTKPRGVQPLRKQENSQAASTAQQRAVPLSPFYQYTGEIPSPSPVRPVIPAAQPQQNRGQVQRTDAGSSSATEEEAAAKNPFREQDGELEQARFSSVLHELGFFRPNQPPGEDSLVASPPEQGRASATAPSSAAEGPSLASSSFDVQSEVFDLFEPPEHPEQEAQSQALKEKPGEPQVRERPSPAKMESDQVYLLGNPFEGSLPEIFEQDEELKQTVLEQVSEELKQRAARKKRATSQAASAGEKKATKRSPRSKPD